MYTVLQLATILNSQQELYQISKTRKKLHPNEYDLFL
jgi:hypothetical protein